MEKQKKVGAVICEYNPFHFGHKHQIDIMRQNFDVCIGIMSGPFVQRGEVATHDKYSRAAAAVEGGLDLVVELPYPYCTAAAMDFAAAGVFLANALCADSLVFGCEDKGETFDSLANLGEELYSRAQSLVRAEKSLSYPRALSKAAAAMGGKELGEALAKPNNILGLEYITAINRGGYGIKPFPIQRNPDFKSSSEIRVAESYGALPFPAYFKAPPRSLKYAQPWLLYTMRNAKAGVYGVDSSLAATLAAAAKNADSVEDAVRLATGKTYTAARVKRALLALWLGTETALVKIAPQYILLLAANKKGTDYIKSVKKRKTLPIITKPAAYKRILGDKDAFEKAIAAEEKAALLVPSLEKYSSPLCKVPNIAGADM